MNARTNTKGFTIIEVVLVLAIAALIFLMIFIALPALQRGQRDTARKQDVGTVAAAVNSYRSNHHGLLPPDAASMASYFDKLSQVDVAGIQVSATYNGVATPTESDSIVIYDKSECKDADNTPMASTSSKKAAVVTFLENGGLYCQDV